MIRLTIGLALALAAWVGMRLTVGAPLLPRRPYAALPLDVAPPLIGFLLFLWPTGRPLLAGLGIATLGFGLAVADREKRRILDEPVVFADRAELIEVARHPRLYLAFIGLGGAIAVALAIAGAVGVLIWAEPPVWPVGWGGFLWRAVAAAIVGRLCFVLPGRFARPLVRAYAGFGPVDAPEETMRRLGPFATYIVQATTARAERPARIRAAQARPAPVVPPCAGPIVLIQAESFVDASRLQPTLAAMLPNFTALVRDAASAGTMDAPCWGANTIRTELAVLAGLDEAALGLDRFNPYEAFAHAPLPTLAAAARAAGYRTIFVHPYARAFYARHDVVPLLGFDRFDDIAAFADAPTDAGYVTDRAVADHVVRLIEEEGPDCFVFVVTMENHGPWTATHDPLPPAPLPPDWQGLADADAVGRWLRHLAATDAMIAPLRAAIEARGRGWLGFYGDHQPSLAGPFRIPGARDRRTDYALWSPAAPPGRRLPLAAHELAGRLSALMLRTASADRP